VLKEIKRHEQTHHKSLERASDSILSKNKQIGDLFMENTQKEQDYSN